jgi:hypothetical protein
MTMNQFLDCIVLAAAQLANMAPGTTDEVWGQHVHRLGTNRWTINGDGVYDDRRVLAVLIDLN